MSKVVEESGDLLKTMLAVGIILIFVGGVAFAAYSSTFTNLFPGFNQTPSVESDEVLLGYNILEDKAMYRDGVSWKEFEIVEINGREFSSGDVREEFVRFWYESDRGDEGRFVLPGDATLIYEEEKAVSVPFLGGVALRVFYSAPSRIEERGVVHGVLVPANDVERFELTEDYEGKIYGFFRITDSGEIWMSLLDDPSEVNGHFKNYEGVDLLNEAHQEIVTKAIEWRDGVLENERVVLDAKEYRVEKIDEYLFARVR